MANTGSPLVGLFLLEGQRALLEGMTLGPATPLLRRAPKGQGQPILVYPGFMAGDSSTLLLRRFLKERGFSPHKWGQGRNLGPQRGVREGMAERLTELHERYGEKISLVGWSLGGVYAREIAKQAPAQVRQVISLGSPFGDIARPSSVSRMFDFVSNRRDRKDGERSPSRSERAAGLRTPPPRSTPSTAIYTKTDGVVHWSTCLEPESDHTENIEVPGSHCGLGFNPLVLYAIAERISQSEGSWQPFDYQGWRQLAFG